MTSDKARDICIRDVVGAQAREQRAFGRTYIGHDAVAPRCESLSHRTGQGAHRTADETDVRALGRLGRSCARLVDGAQLERRFECRLAQVEAAHVDRIDPLVRGVADRPADEADAD